MLLLRGVTMVYTNGSPVNTGFTENADLFGWFGIGRPLGVPTPVWIMGIVFLAALVHAASHASGGVTSTRWAATKRQRAFLVSTSIKSKSSSILFVVCWHRWPGSLKWRVSPPHNLRRGTGYELDAIAAVVLGGTSLAGGKGRIVGTLIGALILGFLNNGLNLLGVSSYYQMIVKAVVILLAVLVDNKKAVITTTGHLEYEHEKTGYPRFPLLR